MSGCDVDLFRLDPYWVGRRRSSSPNASLLWRIDAYSLYCVWHREMGLYDSGEEISFGAPL